jgi:hypothetical protein
VTDRAEDSEEGRMYTVQFDGEPAAVFDAAQLRTLTQLERGPGRWIHREMEWSYRENKKLVKYRGE